MAEHVSYWTLRRQINANVERHIASLESEQQLHVDFDESFLNENRRDFTENLAQNVNRADSRINSQPNLSIDLKNDHPSVDIETYYDGNETCLNSEDIERNMTYLLSDTDSESSDSSDECRENLPESLREWAIKNNVPNISLGDLLKILRPSHPDLPKDPRTLLCTETSYNIMKICGGEYFHFGLSESMTKYMKNLPTSSYETDIYLKLQINIDGLPLFRSSQHQFWPILGMFKNDDSKEPFIIGIFSGTSKPNNLHDFLRNFIQEYEVLRTKTLSFEGKNIHLVIHSVICDAPARAFVKCVKSFSGYHGCDKCTQEGEWRGKMTFPKTDAQPRTDTSFMNRTDEEHHKGVSPFVALNIGMVTHFPLDYMHLVCLGVTKRFLLLLMKGPLKCRLSANSVKSISENLEALKNNVPSEFARKPRTIYEIDRWKATEYRQFLLYTGLVVLHGIVHPNIYQNFLLLHVGIHILLNDTLSIAYNQYAHDILEGFVNHFSDIFGKDMVVYNVHCLVHLSEDAKVYGSLDNISSFPFENFLAKLKRMVRKPTFPLSQIIRRLSEQTNINVVSPSFPVLKKEHQRGPLTDELTGLQYTTVKTLKFQIKLNVKDSCVRLSGSISIVKNIVQNENDQEVYIVYKSFKKIENFFTSPLDSSLLGIVLVSELENEFRSAKLSSVETKCILLPFKNKYLAIPFTDSVWPETRLPYAVVEFTAVNEVEVVPTNWLTGGEKQCYWPNRFKAGKLSLAVKNAVAPSHEFKPLAVRVLYKGSYDQARRKLALAELTSDLQTDDENTTSKRVVCPNPRYESGTEESEEEDVSSRPKKARKSPPPAPPPPPVISLQIPTTPRSSERTGACPSVAPSCLSPLPAIGGSASATPSTSGSSALPSLFDRTPDRNIGASAMDRKLLTQIEEIKVKVNLNTKLLHALMRKVDNIGSSNTEDNTELLDQTFPLATRQDIHNLESRLDEELKGNLIKILSGIGGETLKATVRRVLTYMIKNELAKQINWKGKGDKIAFSTLKLKDLLIKAVRKNRLCTLATESEIGNITKEWFRYATDREGGRKLREERKRAREAAVEQTTDDEDHGS